MKTHSSVARLLAVVAPLGASVFFVISASISCMEACEAWFVWIGKHVWPKLVEATKEGDGKTNKDLREVFDRL